jgi:nitric oxide dioxygenase
VLVDVPALGHAQTRQYSLSEAPQSHNYRISVKKEPGLNTNDPASAKAPGLVSTLLTDTKNEGDIIKLSHPMGNFVLDSIHAIEEHPLVLISGGIGLTPLTSILNSLVSRSVTRPISWVHSARAADVRAFATEIDEISRTKENVRAVFFDGRPERSPYDDGVAHVAGKCDLSKLDKEEDLFLNQIKTEYYICGPTGFMIECERALVEYGVDPVRIHMEVFGLGSVVPRATS